MEAPQKKLFNKYLLREKIESRTAAAAAIIPDYKGRGGGTALAPPSTS
jgi:hypothetical protein